MTKYSAALLATLVTSVSGCVGIIPGSTTMMMKKVEPPAKIAVTDYGIPYFGNRTRVAWWAEEPVWSKVVHEQRLDGRWTITRVSTNLPVVRVLVDERLGGRDCRWASMRLRQTEITRSAGDYNITASETSFDEGSIDHQYTWDCEKIKAVVAGDPDYKAAMEKEE